MDRGWTFVCVKTVGYEVFGSEQHQTQGELPPIVCKAEGVRGVSVPRSTLTFEKDEGFVSQGGIMQCSTRN